MDANNIQSARNVLDYTTKQAQVSVNEGMLNETSRHNKVSEGVDIANTAVKASDVILSNVNRLANTAINAGGRIALAQ